MEFPEHEKLLTVKEKYRPQEIVDFLRWLRSYSDFRLCELVYPDGHDAVRWRPLSTKDFDNALSDYMGIDAEKLRAEKEEMYVEMCMLGSDVRNWDKEEARA
jgi:hypothetical protein